MGGRHLLGDQPRTAAQLGCGDGNTYPLKKERQIPMTAEQRSLWVLPIIIVLLMVGTLLIFAQGSALAPFIYTIF